MTQPAFDKQEQYDKIASGLLQGEHVIAVYDARVVLQDNSLVGKKVALTSLPYSRISVSFVSDKSMLGKFASSSAIAVTVGAHSHEVEFRGEEKAKHCHDAILWHMLNSK